MGASPGSVTNLGLRPIRNELFHSLSSELSVTNLGLRPIRNVPTDRSKLVLV